MNNNSNNVSIKRVKSASILHSSYSKYSNILHKTSPRNRVEYRVLIEKLRELQLRISQLHRQIKIKHIEDARAISFARNTVLSVNAALGAMIFTTNVYESFLKNRGELRQVANISAVNGMKASLPFLISHFLLKSFQKSKRNTGFLLSSLYSLFLCYKRILIVPNTFGIIFNLFYFISRHYYLNGLLSFSWVSHLH